MAQIKVQGSRNETIIPVYRDLLGQAELVQRDLFLFKAVLPMLGVFVVLSGVGWSVPAATQADTPGDFPIEPVVTTTTTNNADSKNRLESELAHPISTSVASSGSSTSAGRLNPQVFRTDDRALNPPTIKPTDGSNDANGLVATLVGRAQGILKNRIYSQSLR